MKKLKLTFIFIFGFLGVSFAEESISIVTYYPSPYGVYNELTTKSNAYLATDGGNVGIGTTNPKAKLHLDNQGAIRLSFNEKAYPDDYYGYIKHAGAGNSPYTVDGGLRIVSHGPSAGNSGGDIRFFGGPSETQWMVIRGDTGYVGIGTTSPGAKLHIVGNMAALIDSGSLKTNPSYGQGFVIQNSGGYPLLALQGSADANWLFSPTGTDRLRIGNVTDAGVFSEFLSIQRSSGNVGIGTTSPQAKLDVNGKIEASGDICTDQSGGVCLSAGTAALFGGAYWTKTGVCQTSNPMTGSCSCPSGYASTLQFGIEISGCQPCLSYYCYKKL